MMFAIREKLENFAIFLPLEATILTEAKTKTEVYLTGFLTIFRMPLAACLCDAQEPS